MISIITPTFNSVNTIERNVKSVIGQNYTDFEHIIVDNLSTDGTIEKIKSLYKKSSLETKLKIISEKDKGISDAFNKGINASSGEIIAILNGDDNYFDNTVFTRISNAFADNKVLIAYGDIEFIDSLYGSNRRAPQNCPASGAILFNHPAMFVRKSLYDELGLYKNEYRVAMDTELFYRIKKHYKDVESISSYITEIPLAVMYAGGASWNQEINGIKEMEKALKLHGFWNFDAKKIYTARIVRTRIKKYLTILNLNFIVKIWRKLKWKNNI